jgi:hypothetical protein
MCERFKYARLYFSYDSLGSDMFGSCDRNQRDLIRRFVMVSFPQQPQKALTGVTRGEKNLFWDSQYVWVRCSSCSLV